MKCKFCGFSLGLIKSGELADLCSGCMIAIGRAAIADGYTLADGVVMKPCAIYSWSEPVPGGILNMHDHKYCTNCEGSKLVKAGGGGT